MFDDMEELTEEELLTTIEEMFEAQTEELTEKQEQDEKEEEERLEQEQQEQQAEEEQAQELVEIVEQLHDDIYLQTKINIAGYVMLALVLGILIAKVFWEKIR